MTEGGNSVESYLSLADLRDNELCKFGSGKRIVHIAAACSKPDLTCINVSEFLHFRIVLVNLDLVGTARLIDRIQANKEASVLLCSTGAGSHFISVFQKRSSDYTGLVAEAKHTKLGAPLEDHLILKNAV